MSVVDFHNHLLAGVDDGASDLDQGRAALREMHEQGVREIVVTPHLRAGVTERPAALEEALRVLDRAYDALSRTAVEDVPGLRLHRGVELMLDTPAANLSDPRLRLAGTSFVLVEFPGLVIPPHSVTALYHLRQAGWIPIVAHPERYHNLDGYDIVDEWRSVGAFLQMNQGSPLGRYGARVRAHAWALLGEGWVDYLCTDHHARGAVPIEACRAAFAAAGGDACFRHLTEVNPARMLRGEEPLPAPPLVRQRSLWQRLSGRG